MLEVMNHDRELIALYRYRCVAVFSRSKDVISFNKFFYLCVITGDVPILTNDLSFSCSICIDSLTDYET